MDYYTQADKLTTVSPLFFGVLLTHLHLMTARQGRVSRPLVDQISFVDDSRISDNL